MSITTALIAAFVLAAAAAVVLLLFRRAGISSMALVEFSRRLARGWRAPSVGPERLRELRRRFGERLLLVDLRPTKRFAAEQIPGALSRPFDDFLKELVVDGRYDGDKERPIVLVCDKGLMSRVAADIMVKDEGFSRAYSLRGGMKAWRRSMNACSCPLRRALARCC